MADAIVSPVVCENSKNTLNWDCGIYAIISPSGKRYVGQAQSFKIRWSKHRSALRRGVHPCRPLQRAWDKYGEESFIFAKIAIVAVDELDRREQEQFDSYINSENRASLYNASLCAESIKRGVLMSEDAKAKISLARKGKERSPEIRAKISATMKVIFRGENNPNFGKSPSKEVRERQSAARSDKKPVLCIELDRNFSSMKDAERWLRENGHPAAVYSGISRACQGKRKTCYGYSWRYA